MIMDRSPIPAVRLGTLSGVGVGPGDPELLTLKAVKVLQQAAVIFHATGANSRESVSLHVVASALGRPAPLRELVFTMRPGLSERAPAWRRNARLVADELQAGRDCAFVTIGDPSIYSTWIYLLREVQAILPDVPVQTVPGITSFQAAAARLNRPLVEDRQVLTVIPAWDSTGADHPALATADTVVLLKTYRERRRIAAALARHHLVPTGYAARLGLADELVQADPADLEKLPTEYLSLLIAQRART